MKTLIYLGTPELSAHCLEKLAQLPDYRIVGVVTQPDKPVGRLKVLTPSPVAVTAARLGLPVYKPQRLNKDYGIIADLQPDLLLTFAYGQIIAEKVLALSRYQALNLHASLLPAYRGAAPLQYALRRGEKETGVSLMAMVKAMDAGAVYARAKIAIAPEDNYTSLSEKIAELGFQVASQYLPEFFAGRLEPQPQDESLVTFAPSIKPEEEHLEIDQSPASFVNQVRSLALTPGGYLWTETGEKLKIYRARCFSDEVSAELGTIVSAHRSDLVLQVAGGQVALELLQRAGKKTLDAASFNNGQKWEGKVLQ